MTRINYPLLALNILAVAVYFSVFFSLKTTISSEIMFSTPDAGSYKNVADWLLYQTESESVSIRPILYPLLIMTTTKIGGVYLLWFIQFAFWLLSVNLCFLTVQHITKSTFYSFLGAVILISNLSLIALTLHGLTEVTTVFLLSILIFYLAKRKEAYLSLPFFQFVLFMLVLLTIVKPTFYIPLLTILFIAFPLLYLKKLIKSPSSFFKLALILLPLIVQLSIIKTKYGSLKVSLIGSITLRDYILPQGIITTEGISFDEARIKSREFSQDEQIEYMTNHLSTYLNLFFMNIKDNLNGSPTFLLFPEGYENHEMANFESKYNKYFLILNILFTALLIPLLFLLYKKQFFSTLVFLSLAFALWQYYVLVTGISFMQGDRLTLPVILICACIFPITIFYYIQLMPRQKKLPAQTESPLNN